MKLCLDSLTLNDTEPSDLIRAAKHAGFDVVSLWVQPPPMFPAQLVTAEKEKNISAALADAGIQVGPLEVFVLSSAEAIKTYRPALELGAKLGARSASTINLSSADPQHVAELLAQFWELANEFGLEVTLEPLAMFGTTTLAEACRIIQLSRVDAGIVFDAFHLCRKGGSAADLRALPPGMIRHAQLCDGEASVSEERARYEASYERLYPGDGVFPLVELFENVSTDITWGIEAPSRSRSDRGLTADMIAAEAMKSVLGIIERIPEAKRRIGR